MSNALPIGWGAAPLGELLPLSYGKAMAAAQRDGNGNVPVYGSSGIVGRHSIALTSAPAIIVGRKGTVGAIYLATGPSWPIDTVYYTHGSPDLNLRYWGYYLQHLQLARLDRSTAVPGLSRNDYSTIIVPVPPAREQNRIVLEIEEHLSRLDAAVAGLERVRAQLPRYRARSARGGV